MKEILEKGRIVKVSPALEFGVPRKGTPIISHPSEQLEAMEEIEQEKRLKEVENSKRYQEYLDIMLNKPDDNWHYWEVSYTLTSIILSNVLCAIITLIPMHNTIVQPFYWWETVLQATFGFFSSCAAYMLLNCGYWMNTDKLKTWKTFFIFFLFIAFRANAIGCSMKMIWTEALMLPHPFPFFGMIIAYIAILMSFVGLWFSFPKGWRKTKDIWRRFKFFMYAIVANLVITLVYSFYTKAFAEFPVEYQWGLALFLIPVREFNMWLQQKVASKAAGVESNAVDITCGHNINNRHCFFLSVVLGTSATDLTCWIILAVDFSINMFLMFRAIWIKRKGISEKNEAKVVNTLMELVVAQAVEVAVPFTYLTTFLVAYFGPNATLLGGVLNDWWHYSAVTDLGLFLENVGLFLFADCVSISTAVVCMKIFANINVLRAFVKLQKEFWLLMAVNTAYTVNMVNDNF